MTHVVGVLRRARLLVTAQQHQLRVVRQHRVHFQLAEAAREGDVLRRRDVLIAEDQHLVLHQHGRSAVMVASSSGTHRSMSPIGTDDRCERRRKGKLLPYMADSFTPPLIYRMVNSVGPSPNDQNAEYVAILRGLRKCTATSLVEAALRILWASYPTKVEELQTAPWHILLLLKWAFRDPHVALRAGKPVTASEFDALRQKVQDLVGAEYKRHRPQIVFLMLRAHLQQIHFQRPEGWGFLRWPALIAR